MEEKMKKMISLLGSIGMIATVSGTVASCVGDPKSKYETTNVSIEYNDEWSDRSAEIYESTSTTFGELLKVKLDADVETKFSHIFLMNSQDALNQYTKAIDNGDDALSITAIWSANEAKLPFSKFESIWYYVYGLNGSSARAGEIDFI
jgi:hypothetical protein